MKKFLTFVLLAATLLSSVSLAGAEGERTITFWYSMSGNNGGILQSLIDEFNQTKGKEAGIFVSGEYQGAYTAAAQKLTAAIIAGDLNAMPNIVQQGALTVAKMKDYEEVLSFENILNNYQTSMTKDMFVPNFLCASNIDGEAIGMPFASSTIILYYNKDAFREAGLDPEEPPKTLKELGEYCQKLTMRNEDGSISRYGIVMQPDSWFLSSWLCQQKVDDGHAYFANNHDGRMGGPATHTIFKEQGTMKNFLEQYIAAYNVGGWKYLSEDDRGEFAAGTVAMFIGSTSSFYSVVSAVEDKFTWGCAAVPTVDETAGGVAAGGSALYVINRKSEQEIKDTITFLEYLTSTETQYKWYSQTGYFPVNMNTFSTEEMAARIKEYPQLQAAINQLLASEPTLQEPLINASGIDSILADNIIDTIEGNQTIDECVDKMTEQLDAAISEYLATLN